MIEGTWIGGGGCGLEGASYFGACTNLVSLERAQRHRDMLALDRFELVKKVAHNTRNMQVQVGAAHWQGPAGFRAAS